MDIVNDKKSKFDLFPVSVHIFFKRDNTLLMLRRKGTGFCDGMYSVPAGHVMQNESILQAVSREAKEEVGVKIELSDCKVVGIMFRRSTEARIDFFIEVKRWRGEPINLEPEKCDDLSWYPILRLPQDTIPYIIRAISKDDQITWFEEYL